MMMMMMTMTTTTTTIDVVKEIWKAAVWPTRRITAPSVCVKNSLRPWCANRGGYLVAVATEFFTVAPSICGCSVRNVLYVTLLEPRILRRLLNLFFLFL
jgi:hypothetical protein